MQDEKQWKLAMSRLYAVRSNVPPYISEGLVGEYHSILDSFEHVAGEDLNSFRIPPNEVKPRVVSFTLGRPGSTVYSKDRFCDKELFKRKIDSLSHYLQSIEPSTRFLEEARQVKDYWSMPTPDLEALARQFNIEGYGDANGGIDRNRIINGLIKRDRAMREGAPTERNTIHVENMTGSVIQQSTRDSQATLNFKSTEVSGLLAKVRKAVAELQLSDTARAEMVSDLETIDCQLKSPHPKPRIISESFQSVRTILEGVAGNVLASGLAYEISRMFPN